MKIEKISETQVKFTFSKSDLLDKNIKLEELISPTEKTQLLFRDIMAQAMEECDFNIDNTPIMVEAFPVATDGIMIIVTKVNSQQLGENKTKMAANLYDTHKFKRKTISDIGTSKESPDDEVSVFAFKAIDDVIDCSKRIREQFSGESQVYKYENKYFLVLQQDPGEASDASLDDTELILSEYGEKHISSLISKYYLNEHGELILKSLAVEHLADNF